MSHENFREMVGNSRSILILSHLAADYDAVCSLLLLSQTLSCNYPGKHVVPALEDKPYGAERLAGHETIQNMLVTEALKIHKPDCIILVDTNRYKRVTRLGELAVKTYAQDNDVRTAVIDHHELEGGDGFDIRIQNPALPAATQMVYDLCYRELGMVKPVGYGLTTMTGIVADSGTFAYDYDDYSGTFRIVDELTREGITVGEAVTIVEHLDVMQLKIIGEFADNLQLGVDYAFSYISDETAATWRRNDEEPGKIKAACVAFGNRYVGNIGDKEWGVIVHPNASTREGEYYASFRARAGTVDVSIIARSLGGGGGHKSAAGVAFEAGSIDEAVGKVRAAVEPSLKS